jgi:RNA polymerase sigma-70 factor (ECF subfamily)
LDRDAELELVSRLRSGDVAAFDAVYAEYNARLFSFLARLARSRETAEDLLEETWLRLVSHADRLREDTQLGPWLFTVARNLYVSYCRSRMLEDAHAPGMIGLWPSGCHSSPFEETAGHELGRRLEAALAELPLTYREAILLVAVEGLTPSQAAQVCGISGEALRQRLSRGRAMLAERLRGSDQPLSVLKEVPHDC